MYLEIITWLLVRWSFIWFNGDTKQCSNVCEGEMFLKNMTDTLTGIQISIGSRASYRSE